MKALPHEKAVVDFTTAEPRLEFWTQWKRVVNGKVFSHGTCCCNAPMATRKVCGTGRGCKTPCRCYCHKLPPKRALAPKETKTNGNHE